jgi:hypothetical protein
MITQVRCKEKKDQTYGKRDGYTGCFSIRGEVSKAEPVPEKTTYKAWASLKILLRRSPSLPTIVKQGFFCQCCRGKAEVSETQGSGV